MTAPSDPTALVAEWTAAMEHVTPGPWAMEIEADDRVAESGEDRQPEVYVCSARTACDYTVVATMGRAESIPHMRKSFDADWIARCSPAGIAPLLALIAQQAATIEAVTKERDEARGDLSKLMDPELKHLRIEDGGIDLALTGPIVQHMGLVICEHFRASGAENYIEMTFHAKTEPFETYVWTVQKRVGKNSPHDLRAQAEARAAAAEVAVKREAEERFSATERCLRLSDALTAAEAERDRLREALRAAKGWLEGWASAERELAVIDAALSTAKERGE